MDKRITDSKGSPLPSPPIAHRRAKIWLSMEALNLGNFDEALSLAKQGEMGNSEASLKLQAEAYEKIGNYHEAVSILEKFGDKRELLRVAKKAEEETRLQEALLAYQAFWRVSPEQGSLPLAVILWEKFNQPDSGEAILGQALHDYPNSPLRSHWLNYLGNIYLDQKLWKDAISIFSTAITENNRNIQAYIGLGNAVYEEGNLDKAKQNFQKAIALDPGLGDGYFAMANLLVNEKNYPEADIWFNRALELNPNAQWWYVFRGNAARDAGEFQKAFAIYQNALNRFPMFAQVYYEQALLLKQMGEPGSALISIEKAIQFSNEPKANYFLQAGLIYEELGECKKSIDEYEKALNIESDSPNILNRLTFVKENCLAQPSE